MAEAWASIARKDASEAQQQQQSPAGIPESKSSQGLQTLVVDANAFIEGMSLVSALAYELCTIKEVVNEIRDERSRAQMEALPVPMKIMEPSPESVSKVVSFARATGDLHVLSDTDLKIIALTHTLEVQKHGDNHLRTKPPPLIRTSDRKHQHDPPGWGSNVANPEEWDEIPDEDGENVDSHILGLQSVSLESSKGGEVEISPAEEISKEVKPGDSQQTEEKKTPANDDDEEGWERAGCRSTRLKHKKRAARLAAQRKAEQEPAAPPSAELEPGQGFIEEMEACGESEVSDEEANLTSQEEHRLLCLQEQEKNLGEPDARSEVDGAESEQSWGISPMVVSTVACLTTDFAMQNVILQMGLRLFTPTGRQVRELQRWVLRCHACANVTREVERLFCPKCGNGGTLARVSMTIGGNGSVEWGIPRRISIRGTKYSLPLPKGGREGAALNPVLREDQVPTKALYPRSKKKNSGGIEAFISFDDVVQAKAKKGQSYGFSRSEIAVQLSGRRNPNDLHYNRKRSS